MSHVKNYVHCVWATKWRYPFFTEKNTQNIMIHIRESARENNIWIDNLNAYQNHIHCLISLRQDQALADVINSIKGESSCWINQSIKMNRKFSWATGYYAASVSLKGIPVVRQYIQNQASHHRSKTWDQEEAELLSLINTPTIHL